MRAGIVPEARLLVLRFGPVRERLVGVRRRLPLREGM